MNNQIIGILTSTPSFVNNYGSILQAYALQTSLTKIGIVSKIIRYADAHEYVKGRANTWERVRGSILNPHLTMRAKSKMIYNKVLHKSVKPWFDIFQRDFIHFYNSEYIDYNGLKAICNDFSAFIVGSDQVWNPRVHHNINDPGYFLQFVPKGITRIAYAPSIGVDQLPESCCINLREYLESFDFVSIREESGRKLIREICGIDVPVVVDPTLLLEVDDYRKIIDTVKCPKSSYIVYYKFGNNRLVESFIKEQSKVYGYKVVCIPAGLDTAFKPDYSIGPRDFVGLISKADLVCTDSFHAAVFSIIYNRPLMAFCREDETKVKTTMNSRIVGLLDMLGLNSCWCGMGENLNNINIRKENWTDYSKANEILKQKREEGRQYLIKALGIDE